MKYLLKDLGKAELAIVEKVKDRPITIEFKPGSKNCQEYLQALFSQPHATQVPVYSENADDTEDMGTQEKILSPTDPDFFDTIIADAFSLGFVAEVVD